MPFSSRVFLPVRLIYRFDFQLERKKKGGILKGGKHHHDMEELKASCEEKGKDIKCLLPASRMKYRELLESM